MSGGGAHIPQADLIVSDREWAQLSEPHPEREWMLREHIEMPLARWRPISFQPTDDPLFEGFAGVYDVAGDGSMVLLPTPGHTPGSLSMLVRNKGWAPILLVADLAYDANLLQQGVVPGTGDAAVLRASYERVRQLKQQLPDLIVIPSHDHGASENLQRAMQVQRPAESGAKSGA